MFITIYRTMLFFIVLFHSFAFLGADAAWRRGQAMPFLKWKVGSGKLKVLDSNFPLWSPPRQSKFVLALPCCMVDVYVTSYLLFHSVGKRWNFFIPEKNAKFALCHILPHSATNATLFARSVA